MYLMDRSLKWKNMSNNIIAHGAALKEVDGRKIARCCDGQNDATTLLVI